MDRKQIVSRIAKLAKTVAATVAEIQALAIEVLMHAVTHGDVTLADSLLEACGKGIRRQSLLTWLEVNGPFVFDTKSGKFTLHKERAKVLRGIPDADLREQIGAHKWEEAKPEPKLVSSVDAAAELDKLFRKFDKLFADNTVEVKNRELMQLVQSTAEIWHAKRVLMQAGMIEDPAELRAAANAATMHTGVGPVVTPASLMHMLQQ